MIKKIFEILSGQEKKILLMLLTFLTASLLDIISLGLIGSYISLIINNEYLEITIKKFNSYINIDFTKVRFIFFYGFIILTIFIIKTGISFQVTKKIIEFSQRQQEILQERLISKFQKSSFLDHISKNTSEYINEIVNNTGNFSFVISNILRILCDTIILLAILAFLAFNNIQAVVILLLIFSCCCIFYFSFYKNKISLYGERANKESINLMRFLTESLKGFKEIRILSKEDYFHRLFKQSSESYGKYYTKAVLVNAVPKIYLEILFVIFIVIYVNSIILVKSDFKEFIPTIAVFGMAGLRILPIINSLTTCLMQVKLGQNAVNIIYRILNVSPYSLGGDVERQREIAPINNHLLEIKNIKLNGITFRYPNSKIDTLTGVNLSIVAGECVGIVGASGSGKTTLINILLGLLEPDEGWISANGIKMNKESIQQWHSHIFYLAQEPFIIDNTIKKNIALGVEDAEVDMKKLIDVIEKVQLTGMVSRLDNGLDAYIGEGGINISGGQRQRIGLARALYFNRKILIMDESTSSLDANTEDEINREINLLKGYATIVIVAHKKSSLKNCDSIYRVENRGLVRINSHLR